MSRSKNGRKIMPIAFVGMIDAYYGWMILIWLWWMMC